MRTILLITPPYHCGVVEVAGRWLPPQMAYLAVAARRAGVEPAIYDAMGLWKSHEDIAAAIRDRRPDYVATSAITATMPDALRVLEAAKEADPRTVTILGGVHPTFMDHSALMEHPCVDFVVRGEGEETLRELLLCLGRGSDPALVEGLSFRRDGGVLRTPPRPMAQDLDALRPAWDLIDWENYTYFVYPGSRLGVVNTSRGCTSDCTFCSQQKFWQKSWRGRSPGSVLAEVEDLHARYGVDTILLGDEYPTCERPRWEAVLDGLIRRGLPVRFLMETRAEDIVRDEDLMPKYLRAGFVHVYIGVEATSQETLDLIRKDLRVETCKRSIEILREHGMITETSFILGFLHETQETVARTLELSRWYNPDFAHYLALTPWPYSDLFRDVEPHIEVRDLSRYNLIDPIIKPLRMSLADLDRAIIECYRDFYMDKMARWRGMDAQRRDYMFRSMRLIMKSSFITQKLGGLAGMPGHALAAMARLAEGDAP
ncbi:MAG: cobalamin B12-binding domain-containing protein [Elusimicrobia bacterium]|nr:cobalamin B12-binding domain-containing protein [Elusimicrobiota bacterium]